MHVLVRGACTTRKNRTQAKGTRKLVQIWSKCESLRQGAYTVRAQLNEVSKNTEGREGRVIMALAGNTPPASKSLCHVSPLFSLFMVQEGTTGTMPFPGIRQTRKCQATNARQMR